MYIQTEWCESLVSAWTLLLFQWPYRWCSFSGQCHHQLCLPTKVLQQVQATSVIIWVWIFSESIYSSVDHCSISCGHLVPAGHCQHQHVLWSHWSEVFDDGSWVRGSLYNFSSIFSWIYHLSHLICNNTMATSLPLRVLFPNREIPYWGSCMS